MPKNKKSDSKLKHLAHDRTFLEWTLFGALAVLLVAFLFSRSDLWFWKPDNNLGTAFQTSGRVATENADGTSPLKTAGTAGAGGSASSGRSSTSTSTNTTSNTRNVRNNNTVNTNGPTTGGDPNGTPKVNTAKQQPAILTLAAGLNTGDTKQSVEARAAGMVENCAAVTSVQVGSNEQVCAYVQAGMTLTVTYLDDVVVSASLS